MRQCDSATVRDSLILLATYFSCPAEFCFAATQILKKIWGGGQKRVFSDLAEFPVFVQKFQVLSKIQIFMQNSVTCVVLMTSSPTDYPDLPGVEDIPAHELVLYVEKIAPEAINTWPALSPDLSTFRSPG